MDELLAEFLTETNESLAELDVALVRLERAPDDKETLSQIFRLVHTIKGTCGFLGLPRLELVAHAAENVLGRVREGVLAATPDIVSLVLASLDRVKAIVAGLAASGAEPAGDDTALTTALAHAAEGGVADGPATDAPGGGEAYDPGTAPVGTAEPAAAAQTIRVAVDVLEDLMTMVSELVLTRNQLLQLAARPGQRTFAVPLQRLSHITTELQEGVMKTRMQPIGNAWNKLPRLVRDLARELGKKIDARHARRGYRARPPGAGADQGPAHPHGAQLRRSRARIAGRAPRGGTSRDDRTHLAERLPRRRSHHHRDRRRRCAACRSNASAPRPSPCGLAERGRAGRA